MRALSCDHSVAQRLRLARKTKVVGRPRLKAPSTVVTPDTLLRRLRVLIARKRTQQKIANSPKQEDQPGRYWHGSCRNRDADAQFVTNRAHKKREEIADELMITEKKVLEVRYRNQNNEEGLIYAEEKQIGSEGITLRKCKVAHGIKCGITGKIEFYAQPEQERVIPRGWITSILEIEQPSWWNSNRKEVLRDLVWLKAEPALQTNRKKKTDALLEKLIAQRRRGWEEATAVASEIENTFFRGLVKPKGNANAQVLEERLQRVWSLLTASDLEALKQTGLPGLGTNHPHNQQLREWLKQLPNRQAEPANQKQPA